MTDEQINRTIAEACGWTDFIEHPDWGTMAIEPETHRLRTIIPSYSTDLNWMHLAEKVLLKEWKDGCVLWLEYTHNLMLVCSAHLSEHATARQRAEAFLKTLGKWEDA